MRVDDLYPCIKRKKELKAPWVLYTFESVYPLDITHLKRKCQADMFKLSSPKVNLTLDSLQATATNLSNVTDKRVKLPSTIEVSATTIGSGKLTIDCRANVLKKIPDFDLNGKLEGVFLPALNDFSRAYAKLDFEGGTFNLYSEMAANDGKFKEYVKSVMHHIKLVDSSEDKKKPLKLIWESIAGVISKIFQNQRKDQLVSACKKTLK